MISSIKGFAEGIRRYRTGFVLVDAPSETTELLERMFFYWKRTEASDSSLWSAEPDI